MKKERQKNIYFLGASSFLNDAGSEMITPLLPFFITSIGGGGMAVGILSGLREGLSSLFKLFGGWFSDYVGKRKEIIFIGYVVSFLAKLFMGISQTSVQLISMISVERTGKMRDAPRDVIIASSTLRVGEGFGVHQSLDNLGGALGTVMVIFFLWIYGFQFREIVLIASGISLLSLIPVLFVKDLKTAKRKKGIYVSIKDLSSDLKKIIGIFAIFSMANFGLLSFLLLKMQDITGNMITSLVVYTAFSLIVAFCSRFMGKTSDRVGRKKVIIAGYLLFVLICIGLASLDGFWTTAIFFLLYGLVFSATEPVQRALVSDYSKKFKGTPLGFYHFSRGIAMIVGGFVAGYIWDINQSAMFIYLACIGLMSLLILIKYVRSKNV